MFEVYIIFMLGNKFEKKVFNVDLKVLIVSFVLTCMSIGMLFHSLVPFTWNVLPPSGSGRGIPN